MISLVGQDLEEFIKKHGFSQEGNLKCTNCQKNVVYNECFYIKGYACIRFKHECDEQYWVTSLIPISKEEKEYWGRLFI